MKDEPVDVLDKQGNKTGPVVMKSEAHEKGLWHGAVHCWIYNDKGQLLLQRRSPKKIMRPNIWDVSVGGHIAAGKAPLDAIVEETREELGLPVKAEDFELLDTSYNVYDEKNGWRERIILWVYVLKRDDLKIEDLELEQSEVSEVRWIATKGLRVDLKDPAKADQYPPLTDNYRLVLDKIYKIVEADKTH